MSESWKPLSYFTGEKKRHPKVQKRVFVSGTSDLAREELSQLGKNGNRKAAWNRVKASKIEAAKAQGFTGNPTLDAGALRAEKQTGNLD